MRALQASWWRAGALNWCWQCLAVIVRLPTCPSLAPGLLCPAARSQMNAPACSIAAAAYAP